MKVRYMALSTIFSNLRQFECSETGQSGSKMYVCHHQIFKSLLISGNLALELFWTRRRFDFRIWT